MIKLKEISYQDFKKDDSLKHHQKINDSIRRVSSQLLQLERQLKHSYKLKTETGSNKLFKSTWSNFRKIAERMNRINVLMRKMTE